MKIFYGNRSNADLLIYSGFVYDQNANDHLMLKLGISKGDPLYCQKGELLDKLKIARCVSGSCLVESSGREDDCPIN